MYICYLDQPYPYQYHLQDSASDTVNSIHDLHNIINFYLLIILILVSYLILITIFSSSELSAKYLSHGQILELFWTISPCLVLLLIAFPSFRLLYLIDELLDPSLTVKIIGSQWFWSIEMSDFTDSNNIQNINFDIYLLSEDNLTDGQPRLLDVDNTLILPVNVNCRFIVSSKDVIHDFAIPSLGIKIDAIPGRLNQSSTIINRIGRYYGQCSELCGSEHAFIPICIESVEISEFLNWVESMIE